MSENFEDSDRTESFVPLTKGTKVGHYKIVNKIGAGGMGEVYLAEDTKLKRRVALKFLPMQFAFDEQHKARFRREAQAVAKLNHPNVVTIYEVSEFGGRPFIVMEHVGDQILGDFFKKKDCTFDKIIKLAIQICKGLKEAHTAGIVHRDIKPSNILIDRSGRLKLVDFGLATIAGSDKLTKTGSTLGTIGYMSPEQVKGLETDNRSDIFSFGVILYEMLTCRRPFKKEGEAATLKAILDDTPEPLARFKSDLPDDIQRIVSKTLEKNPDNRYQHVEDIIVDLRKLIDSSKPDIRPINRSKTPLILAFGLIFAIIIVGGYFIYNLSQESKPSQTDMTAESRWQNSIAVLPFRDFSTNQDQEPFCDGMTDALIGRLSGIEGLKVISMTSVMRYRTSDRDLKKIGKDLKVNTILEGNIQRVDGAIRIRAQLINVADDAHLWSDYYDRELKSVFAIQDDISRAIVDAMKIKLLGEDTTIITRRYTENIEAYNFYMRGRHLWNKWTEPNIRKAIEYFEKAIELDPNYALAYSGLADAWAVLPGYLDVSGAVTQTEANAKAREAAEMAIGLDENLAEAHTSLGLIHRYESNPAEAEKEFLRAIELNSGHFWAHYWYSMLLGNMAKYPDQIREEDIAFELNPMSIPLISNRAWRKRLTFEWQEAEELYRRLIEIEPNRRQSYTSYAYFLAESMGRNEDAIRQCSLAVQVDKQAYNELAYIYERIGDIDKALWAANMYIETSMDKYNGYDTRGDIYARNGMLDSAEVCFKKALELKPDFANSLWQLGNVYMFRQEYDKAESLYQIIASHPDKETRANGRLYLTQIPLHQGKLKEGLRMLEELKDKAIAESVRSSSGLAYGFMKRGVIYESILNDQKSSTIEYEKVPGTLKDIHPNSWMVAASRGNIAYNFAKEGNFEKAEQLRKELEQDLDRYGPSAFAYYWLSVSGIEEQKGNYDLARTYLEKLYKVEALFYVRRLIGKNYLMAGRPEDAVKVLEGIINRYEPNRAYWPAWSFMTHFYLGQAYEETGRNEEAIEQYETFLDIWKNADEGIEFITNAKTRLARLKSKT